MLVQLHETLPEGLGVQELLMIMVIALFFFGGKELPEIASGLGKGIRAFKRAVTSPESTDMLVEPLTEPSGTDEMKLAEVNTERVAYTTTLAPWRLGMARGIKRTGDQSRLVPNEPGLGGRLR